VNPCCAVTFSVTGELLTAVRSIVTPLTTFVSWFLLEVTSSGCAASAPPMKTAASCDSDERGRAQARRAGIERHGARARPVLRALSESR
jgi:hypothetical protein